MSANQCEIRVLDDDPQVLASVERLLATHTLPVRTFATVEEFFAAGPPEVPACLLLDQHLGPAKGTEVHAAIQARGWHLPTIFLTADSDVHIVVDALRGGADNYLTKPYAPAELIAAIERCLEQARQHWEQKRGNDEFIRRAATLTERERNIVRFVLGGLLNKEIADRLGIALVTVKVHRGRAMRKLGSRNPAELAHRAAQVGLTPLA